jgi:hypothetical protein
MAPYFLRGVMTRIFVCIRLSMVSWSSLDAELYLPCGRNTTTWDRHTSQQTDFTLLSKTFVRIKTNVVARGFTRVADQSLLYKSGPGYSIYKKWIRIQIGNLSLNVAFYRK